MINVKSFLRCTHHLRLKPGAKTVPDLVPLRRTHKRLSLQVRVGMNVVPHTKKLQAKHFSGKWSQFSVKISLCKGDGHMVPSGIFLPHTKKELPSSLSNCIVSTHLKYARIMFAFVPLTIVVVCCLIYEIIFYMFFPTHNQIEIADFRCTNQNMYCNLSNC